MLSDGYERYKPDHKSEGCFPDKFEPDAWVNMAKSKDHIEVNSKQEGLPALIFDSSAAKQQYINLADNSDLLHSARVLKCQMHVPGNKDFKDISLCSKVGISIKE